jgi:site-specific DNA-methyltransferase (adenine-specific)
MNTYKIHQGSNLDILPSLPDNSVDSIVTDPPYELGFMGKSWDSTGIAYNVELWKQCLRVLKPGGHLVAFSGSRTYHRMAVAIEDAGFQIRDQMQWVYGSGFPKSHNIGKAIDKLEGNERVPTGNFTNQPSKSGHHGGNTARGVESKERYVTEITKGNSAWEGWGTALKPAHEPICVARKPLEGTVAENVRKWGVGGLNINGCRVGKNGGTCKIGPPNYKLGVSLAGSLDGSLNGGGCISINAGRWPANLMHDGSDEVLDLFPNKSARFFYCPKASKSDRDDGLDGFEERREADREKDDGVGGDNPRNRTNNPRRNIHPTVKPTELMRYLCRLVTPAGGIVLDPFNGSGSTGKAAILEKFNYIGMELDVEYIKISEARINAVINK